MTDQQLEQRLRNWYRAEIGEAERAPAALRASVAAIPRPPTPFERRTTWAFPMLNMPTRFAVAAVIGVLALGGSFYLFQRGQPSVGGPSPSPTLQSSPTPAPQSSPAAQLTVPAGATTTLLADGRVLIAGGKTYEGTYILDGSQGERYRYLDSAGLYDPTSRTFSPTGPITVPRAGHSAVLLADGRVLVAGGEAAFDVPASAELYDPATGTFSPIGPMMTDAGFKTPVRLLDGRVLFTGDRGQIYDPSSGTFSPLHRRNPFGGYLESVTLLADGRVLIAGGDFVYGVCSASAEIFDPKTNTFSPTGSMTAPRCGSATLLQDGRVLMTAGEGWLSSSGRTKQSSAEIFDPKSGTFSPTGSPSDLGSGHTATLLADGRVLVVGGQPNGVFGLPLFSVSLYDPATGVFSPTGPMAVARFGHTATLLPDGRVLVTGGRGMPSSGGGYSASSPIPLADPEGWLTSAEIYDPVTGTFSPVP